MKHLSTFRLAVLLGLFSCLWLAPGVGRAQSPPWSLARTNPLVANGGYGQINGMVTDASGNVFVTGSFSQQTLFGTTTLTSRGLTDIFVAKYVPATNTWAWAISAGGTGYDSGASIAVSGGNVYITGYLRNDRSNNTNVQFSTASNATTSLTQWGAGQYYGQDLFVAKYVDGGTTATLGWTQVGGGEDGDAGTGIAVSGTSVYVTGYFTLTAQAPGRATFGGSGTTVGTVVQAGAGATYSLDMVVAKYQDNGPTASVAWTQVAGGTGTDAGNAIAVSGNAVYVGGSFANDQANNRGVLLGGAGLTAGTRAQPGIAASESPDAFVARYTDAGSSAAVAWVQLAGGTGRDYTESLAANGTSLYVAGELENDRANSQGVLFGYSGTTAGTVAQYGASTSSGFDSFLAKYQDNGPTAAVQWTQVAGGTDDDYSGGLTVVGSSVYVAMALYNSSSNLAAVTLGGSGTVAGTVVRAGASVALTLDVVLARYTDRGTSATVGWTQVGGGDGPDLPYCCALAGSRLLTGGYTSLPSRYGTTLLASPSGGLYDNYVLAAVDLTGFLATTPTTATAALAVYPNPASGAAHLTGAPAGTTGQVTDALGRAVATFTTDVSGAALLPAGLAPGVYVVRVGAAVGRWVVQ